MTRPARVEAAAPVEALLHALPGVRREGKGWRSKCPACGGKSHKVAIAEGHDGRVLLHAFCGCEPASVLQAVGLSLADLFPARLKPQTEAERRELQRRLKEAGWRAALGVLTFEATVVAVAASQVAQGVELDKADSERLASAIERIETAREVLNGRD